jgi:hypothetical protein
MFNIFGNSSSFRPRHLNLSGNPLLPHFFLLYYSSKIPKTGFQGCHNISLRVLNRLTHNGDSLLSLNVAGCFQLFAHPDEPTEHITKQLKGWHYRNSFLVKREPEIKYNLDARNAKGRGEEEEEAKENEAVVKLREHQLRIRELASNLGNLTTLNLSGKLTPI